MTVHRCIVPGCKSDYDSRVIKLYIMSLVICHNKLSVFFKCATCQAAIKQPYLNSVEPVARQTNLIQRFVQIYIF